jgi:hypothetical protein
MEQTSSWLMLLSLDSPNMTSEGLSSTSLTLSSMSQKSHTAITLDDDIHGDFLRCTDEAQTGAECVATIVIRYWISPNVQTSLPPLSTTLFHNPCLTLQQRDTIGVD